MTDTAPHVRTNTFWRSARAIGLGALTVIVTSLAADQFFHLLQVFPPWGEPMNDTGDNLLAFGYRVPFGVLGSYVTARWAPHHPWRHVWIGAAIGFVLSSLGAAAAINAQLGPAWYPLALALSTFPCAWLGGLLFQRQTTGSPG